MSPGLIAEQIAALLEDAPPQAIKTGALGAAAQVSAVALALAARPELPLVIVREQDWRGAAGCRRPP